MIYEIDRLCFTYPGGDRRVLNDIGFTLAEGEILTVLGPNGAGKSTLLRCMLNLLAPESGCVSLCGRDVRKLRAREAAGLVSYVQQTRHASFPYTVRDFVRMGRAPMLGLLERPGKADDDAVEQALCEMGICALADKPCTQLSGGEYQQAMIARAIVRSPRAILFDEPTAHLDFGNQLRTLRIIRRLSEAGYALVVTTHNPDHAILLGGSAAILDAQGRLCKGSSDGIVTEENLRNVYGEKLLLRHVPEAGRAVCIYPNL